MITTSITAQLANANIATHKTLTLQQLRFGSIGAVAEPQYPADRDLIFGVLQMNYMYTGGRREAGGI